MSTNICCLMRRHVTWQFTEGQKLYLFGNTAILSFFIISGEEYFMLQDHNQNFVIYHHKHKADFREDPFARSFTSQLGNATLEAGKLEALLGRFGGQGASSLSYFCASENAILKT